MCGSFSILPRQQEEHPLSTLLTEAEGTYRKSQLAEKYFAASVRPRSIKTNV